ncbi:MAG TPA: HD domain-containing protein [Chitinophagaceae bacterium]|nr:HD domain-containing protein [Chitinophagaceae bacterium]
MADFQAAERFILSRLQHELSPKLSYHNAEHTQDVLNAAMLIAGAEQVSSEEMELLRVAVLFHDAGYIQVYPNHEEAGCAMVNEFLPRFGFNRQQTESICRMIMATKYPQHPHDLLEKIIGDADLDYLGKEDVHRIAARLYDELIAYHKISDKQDWNAHQVRMLEGHHYHTNYSREHREPNKRKYLESLLKKINPS